MSAAEIDAYLAGLDEPRRSTLEELRRTILRFIPEAEQGLSYRMPAFRVKGATVAGFAGFTKHLSYVPFSGSVIPRLGDAAAGYGGTKSSLHFPVDRPLPAALVGKLIALRLEEVDARARR